MGWSEYRTKDELDYESASFYGSLGTYDSNGYYIWFPPYNTSLT